MTEKESVNDHLVGFRKRLDTGVLKALTPNSTRMVLDEIDRLKAKNKRLLEAEYMKDLCVKARALIEAISVWSAFPDMGIEYVQAAINEFEEADSIAALAEEVTDGN